MSKHKNLDRLRHSAAHLLAAAVKSLWKEARNAIGPAIENGFYQDFDMGGAKVTEEDFPKIEKEMNRLLKEWVEFKEWPAGEKEARKAMADNKYKLELIDDFTGEGKEVYLNDPGNFIDLCKGGHVDNPKEALKHFRLLSIAGAYWRGDEKNKMLTRIYGTVWPSKKELDRYLWQKEEAKKRDHRKLGKMLDLYHFQPEAPGMPFWHPKGMVLRNELFNFSREVQQKYGYHEVQTPAMMRQKIYQDSGHWDHYKDDMFFTEYESSDDIIVLKPMNCPGMIQLYKERPRSYRDLPLRLSEYGVVNRKEQSGELNGLFRVMRAWQDDAHLFVEEKDIPEIVHETIQLVDEIYKPFGIEFEAFLSTRPDKYMGRKSVWDTAEKSLAKAMEAAGLEVNIKEKDGAFYGPKIDYQLYDALGRDWQCATIQLDFQMPRTFEMEYTGKDGKAHRPVIIHRTILGSIERFIGILVEHYAGAFPVWLAPVQATIIPISNEQDSYAKKVAGKLRESGIRVELWNEAESMQNRIRKAEKQKVPYMLIVGKKEAGEKMVALRGRGEKDLGQMKLSAFIKKIEKQIIDKALD